MSVASFRDINLGLQGYGRLPPSMEILGPSNWFSRKLKVLNPYFHSNVTQAYQQLFSICNAHLTKAEALSKKIFRELTHRNEELEWDRFLTDFIYFHQIYMQCLGAEHWPPLPPASRMEMLSCIERSKRIAATVMPACAERIRRMRAIYNAFFSHSRIFIRYKNEWVLFFEKFYLLHKTLAFCLEKKQWKPLPVAVIETLQSVIEQSESLAKKELARRKLAVFVESFRVNHRVRRSILPSDLHGIRHQLAAFSPNRLDVDLFASYICRRIQKAVESAKQDTLISYPSFENTTKFCKWEKSRTTWLKTPVTFSVPCTLRIIFQLFNGRIKKLSLIFSGEFIIKGGYKSISQGLIVDITARKQFRPPFQISSHENIVARITPARANAVLEGLKIQDEILKKVPANKKHLFVPLPAYYYRTTANALEIVLRWFQGDLLKAAEQKALPKRMLLQEKHPSSIRLTDLLHILYDVCKALEEMHKLGIVHKDVKATNILVEYSEELKRWVGKLGDFDLSGSVGFTSRKEESDYPYWSLCAQRGLVSFEGDGYGVVTSLGELFFLSEFHKFRDDRKLILTSEFNALLFQFLKKHTLDFFNKFQHPLFASSAKQIEKLSQPSNDKDLFECLNQLRQENLLKDYHLVINRLVKELMMYQMVHSFIKNCVVADIAMAKKADNLNFNSYVFLNLTSKESQARAVIEFFKNVRQENENVFSVQNLRIKIGAMYESLART